MQSYIKVRMEWAGCYEKDNHFTGAIESGFIGDDSPWEHAAITFARCIAECPCPREVMKEMADTLEDFIEE